MEGGGVWGVVYLHCDGQFSSFHFNARINSTPRSFKVPVKKVQHAHPASKAAIDFFFFSQRAWLLSGSSNISCCFARYRCFFFVSVCAPLIRSTCFVMKNLTHSTPTHLGREEEEMMRSSNLSSTSLNHLLFYFFFFLHTWQLFAAGSRPVHIRSLVPPAPSVCDVSEEEKNCATVSKCGFQTKKQIQPVGQLGSFYNRPQAVGGQL